MPFPEFIRLNYNEAYCRKECKLKVGLKKTGLDGMGFLNLG